MITLKKTPLVAVFVSLGAIFAVSIYAQPVQVFAAEDQNSMSSMMGMCSTMMNKSPKDVTIRPTSSQLATVGKQAEITVLVLDKKTSKPMIGADLPIMIERGPPMSSMEMVRQMSAAKEIGNGKYLIKFTPDKKGIYTIHTHVILGKSMMSVMNNHMDIGIIAK
jgi:hypothetical protein